MRKCASSPTNPVCARPNDRFIPSIHGILSAALMPLFRSSRSPRAHAHEPTRGLWPTLLVLGFSLASAPSSFAAWRLTFSDNFSQSSIDRSKWNLAYLYSPTIINQEQQFYSPDAITLTQSALRITAEKVPIGGQPYRSGVVTTLDKFSQAYGYFEVRARLPLGSGLWPAFWLLPQSEAWPPEIDIFEFLGHAMNTPNGGLIVSGQSFYAGDSQNPYRMTGHAGDGFHTYGLLWQPGLLVFYIDGAERARIQRPEVPSTPMYIILNLAVGGNYPGTPNASTAFPAAMEIDYVRAFQEDPAGPVATLPTSGNFPDTPSPAEPTSTRFYIGNVSCSSTTLVAGAQLTAQTQILATRTRSDLLVKLKLRHLSSNTVVATQEFYRQTLNREQLTPYSATFTLPSSLPAGDYALAAEINDMANQYAWLGGNEAIYPLVASVASTTRIVASEIRSSPSPARIDFTLTASTTLTNRQIYLTLIRAGQYVTTQTLRQVTLTASQPRAISWDLPSSLAPGDYTLEIYVQNPGVSPTANEFYTRSYSLLTLGSSTPPSVILPLPPTDLRAVP